MSDLSQTPIALIDQLRAWFHPKDRSVWVCDSGFISLQAITTPTVTPPVGRYFLYMKADGCLYVLDSNRQECVVGGCCLQ